VVSALGIWAVERTDELIDERRLVEFIDQKYFESSAHEKSLTDKEKTIVLAMIAARAFSPKSAIDLHSGDSVRDHLRTVLESGCELLCSIGLVKPASLSTLFRSGGNEHPVSDLMRHTDGLPPKVRSLYIAPGQQKYYLDIAQAGTIDSSRLSYLLCRVINRPVSVEDGQRVYDFCKRVAYEEAVYLFNPEGHLFADTRLDDTLRQAVREAIVSSQDR
jgi:hypothetical protein